jgi:hypothetical protein
MCAVTFQSSRSLAAKGSTNEIARFAGLKLPIPAISNAAATEKQTPIKPQRLVHGRQSRPRARRCPTGLNWWPPNFSWCVRGVQRRPRKLENDLRRPVVIDVDQSTVADAQAEICGGTASEQAAFGLVQLVYSKGLCRRPFAALSKVWCSPTTGRMLLIIRRRVTILSAITSLLFRISERIVELHRSDASSAAVVAQHVRTLRMANISARTRRNERKAVI